MQIYRYNWGNNEKHKQFKRRNRMKEKLLKKLAFIMPKWLVYFCAIRLIAKVTQGQYSSTNVPKLSAMDALKRWEQLTERR